MISLSRLMILSLLAVSFFPLSLYAQPEPANAPETQKSSPPLNLPMNTAIAMAVHRNIDLRVEGQNSRMASAEAIKSRGIYNPVLNISGTGGYPHTIVCMS